MIAISLEYALLGAGMAMFACAFEILAREAHRLFVSWHNPPGCGFDALPVKTLAALSWRIPFALVMLAWAPLLVSAGMIIAITETTRL